MRYSHLDRLLMQKNNKGRRSLRWVIMLLLGSFLVWSFYTELDEVAVAIGEVVPQGDLKIVQHFEGGVIEQLSVNEGDYVTAGQVLLRLNLAGSGLNLDELRVRLDGLLIRKDRLAAQIEDREFIPNADLAKIYPDLTHSERSSFYAELAAQKGATRLSNQKIKQRELEVQELKTHLESAEQDLNLSRQHLEMSSELLKDGLTPKISHLQISSEVEKLQGQVNVLKSSVPRAEAALEEAYAERSDIQLKRLARLSNVMIETEVAIASVRETLDLAQDQNKRADIKSPINGTVKNVRYHTIGGVVRPGEPILEIVPAGGNLVIKAELNPTDRGYVEKGQKAVVKITTYDFARYGGLDGEVIRIGASTNLTPDGNPYYEVVVRTDKNFLGEGGLYAITPGMQATVDIHTGTRTVLDYLVRPVLKLKHEGFRER